MDTNLMLLAVAIFAVATLYSMVGHAGASGYIAVLSLCGMAAAEIKPLALMLNILVATVGTIQFYRAGHFRWSLFWPFALLSVPLAYVGGAAQISAQLFKLLLGALLLYSALRLLVRAPEEHRTREPSRLVAIPAGGVIGLISGLTGTGGGIFLTPLLLFMRWARVKQAAAVSALFILLNSCAGLLGHLGSANGSVPAFALLPIIAAGAGGVIGSTLGSRRLDPTWIKRVLAVVLMIAGAKLLLTA